MLYIPIRQMSKAQRFIHSRRQQVRLNSRIKPINCTRSLFKEPNQFLALVEGRDPFICDKEFKDVTMRINPQYRDRASV